MNPDLYRLNVGIILLNANSKIFLGQRIDLKGWQMPQGGIEENEPEEEAVFRELEEEVGTNKADIIAKTQSYYYYDLPKVMLQKLWNGRYKGQKQRWFMLKFTGTDADIDLDTNIPEFKNWKWATADEVIKKAVKFKKPTYIDVFKEFKII